MYGPLLQRPRIRRQHRARAAPVVCALSPARKSFCKIHALYDPAVVYVKTWDYPLCKRHASAFTLSMLTLPSYIALPSMTELQPALLTFTISSKLAIPPLAVILANLAASARFLTSGPCSVPSPSILVSRNSSTPMEANWDIASATFIPVDSFQPLTITLPSTWSIEITILPGLFLTSFLTASGSLYAMVPITTLDALDSISSAFSGVLMPPATCTGILTAAVIFTTSSVRSEECRVGKAF